MKVGYVTGNFDLPHVGHFHLLKTCKKRCDVLIVGLTTDETAKKQKRLPFMNYSQRQEILENCKWVDSVLPHNGQKKSEAHRRLGFHICFTCAEEYFDSEEFDELRLHCPTVEIIGIPRYNDVSTTSMIEQIQLRILTSNKVLATGINGPLSQFGNWVLKTIPFSQIDLQDCDRDNYGFFQYSSLPRNYKHLDVTGQDKTNFPFISGIAPGREILANLYFKHHDWSLLEDVKMPTTFLGTVSHEKNLFPSLTEFAEYVQNDRRFPVQSVNMILRFGGETLHDLACKISAVELHSICVRVLAIIKEIHDCGMLHGDIHPRNILICSTSKEKHHVSIIDWGWTCGTIFKLCERERLWLLNRLQENFDELHFLGSLRQDLEAQGLPFPF